jgi:glutathione S-transferase
VGCPGAFGGSGLEVIGALNQRLAPDPWLAGDAFSLADLAWSVDIHRFELIKFPIDEYPAMLVWYRKIEARPSFQRMVLDYERSSGNPFTDPQQIR